MRSLPTFIALLLLILFGLSDLSQAQGIYVDFGIRNVFRNLRAVGTDAGSGSEIASTRLAPEYCAKSLGTTMYFAIDNEYLYQRPGSTSDLINVEYYDVAEREIKLIYDSVDDPNKVYEEVIKTTGSETWKSKSFYLQDSYFSDRQNFGADFHLECSDTMFINVVRVVPIDYYIDFGNTNDEFLIVQKEIQGGDSQTAIVVQDGEECIAGIETNQYIYCDIDDDEIFQGDFPEFLISVEYFDIESQLTFRLQYDSEDDPYKDTGWTSSRGWGSFRTTTWEVSDAYMGGRQNGGSDFRIHCQQPGLPVNRIFVGFRDYGPSAVSSSAPTITHFSLAQNYPNPFNPTTKIEYQLERAGNISLTIYNVQGKLIRTLVDNEQKAGVYTCSWDGLDNHGTPTASGVYLYQLKNEDRTLSNAMLKLK